MNPEELNRIAEEEAQSFAADPKHSMAWDMMNNPPEYNPSTLETLINSHLERNNAAIRVVFNESPEYQTAHINRSDKTSSPTPVRAERQSDPSSMPAYTEGSLFHYLGQWRELMEAMEKGNSDVIESFVTQKRGDCNLRVETYNIDPQTAETHLQLFDADAAVLRQLSTKIPDIYKTPKGHIPESLLHMPEEYFSHTDLDVHTIPDHIFLTDSKATEDEIIPKLMAAQCGDTRLMHAHSLIAHHLMVSGHCDALIYAGSIQEMSYPGGPYTEAKLEYGKRYRQSIPTVSMALGELDEFLLKLKKA